MSIRRGRRAAVFGALTLAVCLLASVLLLRERIVEAWWLHQLESSELAVVKRAVTKLVEAKSKRAVPVMATELAKAPWVKPTLEQVLQPSNSRVGILVVGLCGLGRDGVAALLGVNEWWREIDSYRGSVDWVPARAQLMNDLIAATRHTSSMVRRRALLKLEGSLLREKACTEAFVEALEDPNPEVCETAARVLADAGLQLEACWPILVEMLSAPDAKTRIWAVSSLAGMPGHETEKLALLRQKVAERDLARDIGRMAVLDTAAWALIRLAPPNDSLALISGLLDDPSSLVKRLGLALLDFFVHKWGSQSLDARRWVDRHLALLEQNPVYADSILRPLGRLGAGDARVVELLLRSLTDADATVRASAADALGELGTTAAPAVPVLARLAADTSEDSDVVLPAIEALGKLGGIARSALPVLFAAMADASNAGIRSALLRSLGSIAAGSSEDEGRLLVVLLPLLREGLQTDLADGMFAALKSLGPRAREAVPLLRVHAVSPEALIWYAMDAVETSWIVEGDAEGAWRLLQEAITTSRSRFGGRLQDLDPSAQRLLKSFGPRAKAAVPQLAEVLADEPTAIEAWLTIAALDPMSPVLVPTLREMCLQAGGHRSLPPADRWQELDAAVVETVLPLLADPDLRLRLRALQILRAFGPKAASALPALRPFLDDPLEAVRLEARAVIQSIEGGER